MRSLLTCLKMALRSLEAILGVQNVSIDGAVEIAGRGGGNGHHKVRDAFAVSGYSNDHGTAHWATPEPGSTMTTI